jgi:hypothetical protein
MSLRPNVDRARIHSFLTELGRAFRRPARLYLVGGTTLVYEGLREITLDIDYALEIDNAVHGDFMETLARLKHRLAVNVEEASPGDFIPLPPDWRDRLKFIGQFGQIEVFHFDPVSTALSKLARGYEHDLADVRTLITAGYFSPADLATAWNDVRTQLPRRGWSEEEIEDFAANVSLILGEAPPA